MKIFFSWSGSKSRSVAQALLEFTPWIVQSARPFIMADVSTANTVSALANVEAAVICLTKDNINNPWLAFEAGALCATLKSTLFFPLLIDFSIRELAGPLAQFQAVRPERRDLLKMYLTLNASSKYPSSDEVLEKVFLSAWPGFNERLQEILRREPSAPEDVSSESVLRRLEALEQKLAEILNKKSLENEK